MMGIDAIIHELYGNEDSRKAFVSCVGKEIKNIYVDGDGDGSLVFEFSDGTRMRLADCARACCESRYLTCDDDLEYYSGSKLLDCIVKKGPTEYEGGVGEPYETAFLEVKTSKGSFTACTHNEHNGFYGGFLIRASMIE